MGTGARCDRVLPREVRARRLRQSLDGDFRHRADPRHRLRAPGYFRCPTPPGRQATRRRQALARQARCSAALNGDATMTEYVLQAEDVAIHYGGVKAVDGVNMTLERGQVRGLIGPNGAGKSTVIDAITGRRR